MLMLIFGLIMIAGILVGTLVPGIPKESRIRNDAQRIFLYTLLFVLGNQLGGSEDVMASLSHMGFVGIVLAVIAMSGSFGAVLLLRLSFDQKARRKADD